MNFEHEPWYGVRCIFSHGVVDDGARTLFEERIVLVRAESFDEAISKAEAEAENYAADLGGETQYLGEADAYHLALSEIVEGSEIFSLMRTSELGPKDYVSRFFQTGAERSR